MVSTTAVSSVATTAPTSATQPSLKKEEYSIVELVLSYIKEKPKDVVKWFGYSTFWAGQAIPGLHPNVQNFSFFMGDVKNLLGTIEVPEKAYTLWQSLNGLWTDLTKVAVGDANTTWAKVGDTARKTFKDFTGLTNNICDGIDFSTKYVHYEAEILRWIKGINFAVTLTGSGVAAGEQIHNIHKMPECNPKKTTFYLINLGRDVSYVALGAIGLYFVISATPVVPWMILACLTSGLTFTLGSFFYERIVDPENKGKHLNPAVVVENALAQRAATPTA